jgi:hypothetical protein
MTNTNRYGLSRDIPPAIKRQIRQVCGFGCVCCGLAIASYEHIDPEFHEARSHDPDKIAYLCEGCHSRVTRGFWSKEKIRKARENPWCIKNGKCKDAFDISSNEIILWLGGNQIVNIPTIISIQDEPLLVIDPPEFFKGPYMISGKFYNETGKLLFEIVKNEWFGESNNWDIECVGSRITIRTNPRKIGLQISCMPPKGLIIEELNMNYKNTKIIGNQYGLEVTGPHNSKIRMNGRRAIGNGRYGTLFSIDNHGGLHLGPGPFSLETLVGPIPYLGENKRKIGRNVTCPCGSGKKYKKCCLIN